MDDPITLAHSLFKKECYSESLSVCKIILSKDPNHSEASYIASRISFQMENWKAATIFAEICLSTDPNHIKCRAISANCKTILGQTDEAIHDYILILKVAPNAPTMYGCLGDLLVRQNRLEDALSQFKNAHSIWPLDTKWHVKLSSAYKLMGNYDFAFSWLNKALAIKPDLPELIWHRSILKLLTGDLSGGFRDNESRRRAPKYSPADLKLSQWDGTSLKGKSIVLLAEQGWGDQIQFCRYADILDDCGAKVIFACSPNAQSLFRSLKGASQVVELKRHLPLPKADCYAPLLSLPHLTGIQAENIPNKTPYLEACPKLTVKWADKMANGGKLKVGIAWRDQIESEPDENFRNIPLSEFASILELEYARFFALPPSTVDDLVSAGIDPKAMETFEGRDSVAPFEDTMAVIQNLDLVISADCVFCHLAGAMGRPVWTLINKSPDWRWMLERNDVPWYPSMRLIRQKQLGDWTDVISRVKDQLTQMLTPFKD